jgi:hypothetical protein
VLARDSECDDSIFCNGAETCVAGECKPGVAPACDDAVACTDDFCDQSTDSCRHNNNDGTCSDGKFCNGLEICDPAAGDPATGCVAGVPIKCDDEVPCTQDSCDDSTGQCSHTPDDAACDDGVFCNGAEACSATGCAAGLPTACDDGLSCTIDTCDETAKGCAFTPNDTACDDGLQCNGAETCDPLGAGPTGCVAGVAVPCASDGVACTVDACDEVSGSCQHVPDNAACGAGSFCVPGVGNGCSPAKPCGSDAECDDGNGCNGTETCNVVCQPGTPPSCDDSVPCTKDSCDPATGACVHAINNVACDDGLACNGLESCDAKLGCVTAPPPKCDDGVACTQDVCIEPAGTCFHTPIDSLCDDNKLCNGQETCDPVAGCKKGPNYVCPSDGIACTKEQCDATLNACKSVPNDALCPCGQTCSPSGGCGSFCQVQACSNGKVYACGDCKDNDGDCKIDGNDPQCLGACDNTENAGPTQGSGCYFVPPPGQFNPKLSCAWNGPPAGDPYPTAFDATMTPVVINLTDDNGDGKVDTNDIPDIAFISYPDDGSNVSHGVLRVVSGKCNPDGTMKQHFSVGTTEIQNSTGTANVWFDFSGGLAAGDVDGDGLPEIVGTLAGGGTIAITNTGKVKWMQALYPKGADHVNATTPSIANLDGVGAAEIISGRVVLDGKTGSLKWKGTAGLGVNGFLGPVSSVADPDNDGKPNVLAGNTMYNADGTVAWTYTYPVASTSANCGQGANCDGFTATGNFDADDFGEVVIVRAGVVYILNHDGTPMMVNNAPVRINIPKSTCTLNEGGPPTVADFDGDGKPEIGVAGANFYIVADLKCIGTPLPAGCDSQGIRWKVANNDCSSRVTGSSVFDFDGDGNAEVIYNDEALFRIMDGKTGAVLFSLPNHSRTRLEMPIVADVDNDGRAEVVFVENDAGKPNSTRHGLRVWGDANDTWVSTRRIWNQHSYHVTNVMENGQIPAKEPANWLEPTTSTVAGKMNNFRQNLPEQDALAAPDLQATLTFDKTTCPTTLGLVANVCNKGLLQVGSGIPVHFYDDTTKAEITCGNAPLATKGNIQPGACEKVTCSVVPASISQTQVVRICADNAGYDCVSGGVSECVESNNISIVQAQGCAQ